MCQAANIYDMLLPETKSARVDTDATPQPVNPGIVLYRLPRHLYCAGECYQQSADCHQWLQYVLSCDGIFACVYGAT